MYKSLNNNRSINMKQSFENILKKSTWDQRTNYRKSSRDSQFAVNTAYCLTPERP